MKIYCFIHFGPRKKLKEREWKEWEQTKEWNQPESQTYDAEFSVISQQFHILSLFLMIFNWKCTRNKKKFNLHLIIT